MVARLTVTLSVAVAAVPPLAGTSASASAGGVEWRSGGGGAWNWKEALVGTSDCGRVRVSVNGERTRSSQKGRGFEATVSLEPGKNRVRATCPDGSSDTVVFQERLRPEPIAHIRAHISGRTVTLDGSGSEPGPFDHARIERFRWKARPGNPARLKLAPHGSSVSFTTPRRDGEYYVTLTVTDARRRIDSSTTYVVVEDGMPRHVDMATESPAWVKDAVVYGVIPQLFGNDGFRSIERRLGYLQRLGVDAIWLSPVFRSPPGDFGYAVNDFFQLNPDYGTKTDFQNLVNAAHEHGIRVLMDFTANHMSATSAYFQDAKRRGPTSHYWTFFDRKPNGVRTHYFDWTNLPNLNYGNAEVRHLIVAATTYWVRDLDIDGYRMDAAWGVHRRAPDFWLHWHRALKRIKPDVLLIAEASARDPYYFSHGFDAAYDWRGVGQWAWAPAFTDHFSLYGLTLKPELTNRGDGYPKGGLTFRFLNNNDTGARFVDQQGPDLTRVAAVLEFTVPGLPLIYAGDEIGASYFPYEGLSPLDFSDDPNGLRPFYRLLVRLRDRLPALRSQRWRVLNVSPETEVVAYARRSVRGDPVLVMLNFGGDTTVTIPRPQLPTFARDIQVFHDQLTGERIRVIGGPRGLTLEAPATTALVLTPEVTS